MSDTAVERHLDKETPWKMLAQSQRYYTPVPLRKSFYISEHDRPMEYAVLSGRKATVFKDIPSVKNAGIIAEPSSDLRSSSPRNKLLVWIEDWDKYDYLVAIGAILILIGLVIPVLTKDKTLTFVFPIGAACVGAGARLARRDVSIR